MWPRKCGPVSFHERRAASAPNTHKPLRVAINSVVGFGATDFGIFLAAMPPPLFLETKRYAEHDFPASKNTVTRRGLGLNFGAMPAILARSVGGGISGARAFATPAARNSGLQLRNSSRLTVSPGEEQ